MGSPPKYQIRGKAEAMTVFEDSAHPSRGASSCLLRNRMNGKEVQYEKNHTSIGAAHTLHTRCRRRCSTILRPLSSICGIDGDSVKQKLDSISSSQTMGRSPLTSQPRYPTPLLTGSTRRPSTLEPSPQERRRKLKTLSSWRFQRTQCTGHTGLFGRSTTRLADSNSWMLDLHHSGSPEDWSEWFDPS